MFDSTLVTGRLMLALCATFAIVLSGCKGGSQPLSSTIFEPAPAAGSAQTSGTGNIAPATTRPGSTSSEDPTTPSRTAEKETPVGSIPAAEKNTKTGEAEKKRGETDKVADRPNSNQSERDTTKGPDDSTPSLSWVAPATRADGTKLYTGEIKGYRIYYKLRHQESFKSIQLADATTTQFRLAGFKAGAYEFAVTTLDTEGLESPRSKVVSVNII